MRKAVLSCCVLLCFPAVHAQKNSVGVYTSLFTHGEPFQFFSKSTGSGSLTTNKTFLIGAEYTRSLNKTFKLCGGLKYAEHSITTDNISTTGISNPQKGHLRFVTIPLYLRADVLKYVFFTFGTLYDVQTESDRVTIKHGFGLTGGTGLKYDFRGKSTVFVQPYYELHATADYLMWGIRTGLSYRF